MKHSTRDLMMGLAGGAVVAALLPRVWPLLNEVFRPLTKALIRESLLGLDQLRTKAAQAAEDIEDFSAEIQAEVEAERLRRVGAPSPHREHAEEGEEELFDAAPSPKAVR